MVTNESRALQLVDIDLKLKNDPANAQLIQQKKDIMKTLTSEDIMEYTTYNDPLYQEAEKASDYALMEKMKNRDLTREEFLLASEKYDKIVLDASHPSDVEKAFSGKAISLAEKSKGKIVLRISDQGENVIDFPEIGIKGMSLLSVEGSSDIENGLIQGNFLDYRGMRGISTLSYMTGKRATVEAHKKGKTLFAKKDIRIIIDAMLETFDEIGVRQKEGLQTLFGDFYSGFWDMSSNGWVQVGNVSFIGMSEVFFGSSDREVTMMFTIDLSAPDDGVRSGVDSYRFDENEPKIFMVCEDYKLKCNLN